MTWVAVILTPVVLLYQGWTYWVFRKRISAEHIPEHTGLTFAAVTAKTGASTGHGGTSPDGSTRA
jgi:cytochrome d ubiquinol oxidase subunit II